MSTAFRSVLAAVVGALSSAPALAEGRVHANRLQPLPAGRSTAVVVRLEQSGPREAVLGALDWSTRLAVECYARGQVGSDPSEAVDALLQSAWQRLRALDAAHLGAMAIESESPIEWLFDELDTPLACAVIRVTVLHRTPYGQLATLELTCHPTCNPSTQTLPQAGGRYLRQPDGSLLCVDPAIDQPDTTAPADPPPTQE